MLPSRAARCREIHTVPFTCINLDVFQGTEGVSSLAGADGSDLLTQRAEDDSSSAESPDGASHGRRAPSKQNKRFILSLFSHSTCLC